MVQPTIPGFILFIMVACFVVNAIVFAILMDLVLRDLRTKHPHAWRKLGAPTMTMAMGATHFMPTFRFLYQRKYLRINDQNFSNTCSLARLSIISGATLFLVISALVVALSL